MTRPEAAELQHGQRVTLGEMPGTVDTVAITRGIMGAIINVRVDVNLDNGALAIVSGDMLDTLSKPPNYDAWASIFNADPDGEYEMGRD